MRIEVELRPDLEDGVILISDEGLVSSLVCVHCPILSNEVDVRSLEEHPVL